MGGRHPGDRRRRGIGGEKLGGRRRGKQTRVGNHSHRTDQATTNNNRRRGRNRRPFGGADSSGGRHTVNDGRGGGIKDAEGRRLGGDHRQRTRRRHTRHKCGEGGRGRGFSTMTSSLFNRSSNSWGNRSDSASMLRTCNALSNTFPPKRSVRSSMRSDCLAKHPLLNCSIKGVDTISGTEHTPVLGPALREFSSSSVNFTLAAVGGPGRLLEQYDPDSSKARRAPWSLP